MAGAVLKFEGGYIGIERVIDPKDGSQYLRAVLHHRLTGRTSSGPVTNDDVQQFALDVMKQAVFARGYTEDDIIQIGLEKLVDDIRAEQAAAATPKAALSGSRDSTPP